MKKTQRRPYAEAQRPHLVIIPETEPYGVERDPHAPTVEAVGRVDSPAERPTKRERPVVVPPRDNAPASTDTVGRYSMVYGRTRRSTKPPRA